MDGPWVIMDDLCDVVYDKHFHNLEAVLLQVQKYMYRLTVKLLKWEFMAPYVIYFGLRFSKREIHPVDKTVKTITRPLYAAELSSFLGILAALGNFIPKLWFLLIFFTDY